ncbi:MAG: Tox-REase-5 domain-containing protein [Paracoccaceae bacterium]
MNAPRPLFPDEIIARAARPSDNDPGPLGRAEKPCKDTIRFILEYTDTWATRITDVPCRLTDNAGEITEKPTTSLKTFGQEDGEAGVAETLKKLGVFEHNCVEPGFADFETIPEPGAEADVRSNETQTLEKLRSLETEMTEALKPWVDAWAQDGWLTIAGSFGDGVVKGVSTWWEGESEFWGSVGEGIGNAWDSVKRGLSSTLTDFAAYYNKLPLWQRMNMTTAIAAFIGEKIANWAVSLFDDVADLWERRDDFLNVIRGFVNGSIDTIESAFDLLRDLGGEIGQLFFDAIMQASDWIQLLNETIRQSDVIPELGGTLARVLRQMVPNFWAEGLGSVSGYLIPELLIALILALIAALSAGAGAAGLAARCVGMLSKIKKGLKAASKIGAILVKFIDKVDEVAKLIARLAVRAKKNIDVKVRKATNREHLVEVPVRRVRPRTPTYRHGASDGGPGKWGASNKGGRGADYQEQVTGAPRGTEYEVPFDGNASGTKWMDGYDPDRNVLIDAKDWENWPNDDFPMSRDIVAGDLRQAQQIAEQTGSAVEWRVPTQAQADRLLDIADDLGLSDVDVVAVPK